MLQEDEGEILDTAEVISSNSLVQAVIYHNKTLPFSHQQGPACSTVDLGVGREPGLAVCHEALLDVAVVGLMPLELVLPTTGSGSRDVVSTTTVMSYTLQKQHRSRSRTCSFDAVSLKAFFSFSFFLSSLPPPRRFSRISVSSFVASEHQWG